MKKRNFIVTLINLDSIPDTVGDRFEDNVGHVIPDTVPVKFYKDQIVGFAKLLKDGKRVLANVEIFEDRDDLNLLKMLAPCVSGKVLERNKEYITKFSIDAITLDPQNADARIKSLEDQDEEV